ncbi:hypothetical protein Xcel_0395 [Xylanimonas cellulosilytica DSM 15894]|uniref:Intracellular proteinase inhibitor BsuPI domain-containing protein n=1 Tax=Xylanimonas cellulosilytica (strain DSM 15894 / JCM 12276 / CECT 5975 / KCTC 9989 / LMG 20990 / NBRC 107835 / XIL07) TaxID=446471 RepID=D1BVG3_XYLCX|nr:hypothetical protein [Xylanimonas cellulosilytica]ACZ29434.1 hypothetical protein Xcel_0395 [Xylanimonas cellulosilytica DSM 15894]
MPVIVLGLLVGLGWTAGYGIGQGVAWVRDVWPDPVPRLVADKVAAPEPADVGGPIQACPASSLTLAAIPDAMHVQPGQTISFDVSITNSGRRPCLVNAGDASRQLVVTDAEGVTVWTTAHCGTGARDLLLGPGDVRQSTLRWSGRASVEGACTTGQDAVPPGTYTAQLVMADVLGAKSTPATITIEAPPPPPEPTPDPTTEPPAPTPDNEPTAEAEPTDDQTAGNEPADDDPAG